MLHRTALVLEVDVGKFLDTSLIKADVQPRLVRLLIKGRLLQLVLPMEVGAGMCGAVTAPCVLSRQAQGQAESVKCVPPMQVMPDSSVAQRSAASGRLVLSMPKEDPTAAVVDVAYLR
jgi:protein TilB